MPGSKRHSAGFDTAWSVERRAQERERGLHHRAVADDHGAARGGDLRRRQGLGGDLGPDAGGVAHGDAEQRETGSRHAGPLASATKRSGAPKPPALVRIGSSRRLVDNEPAEGESARRRAVELEAAGAERPHHGVRGLAAGEDDAGQARPRRARPSTAAASRAAMSCARAFEAGVARHEGGLAGADRGHDLGQVRLARAAEPGARRARRFERVYLGARRGVPAARDDEPASGRGQGGAGAA